MQNNGKDIEKVKVFLLSGFLGSGKTTLLNQVLSWRTGLSDTVVLVNEFGKIGVDASLIKTKDNEVIEMTSGCICCSIKTKLIDTLIEIMKTYKPKKILLEATGVAEPNSIAEVFNDSFLRDRMTLSKIITVLDIRYWNGREKFGPFFMNQVQQADLVLLNKIDLVPKDKVGVALSEMHKEVKGCNVVPTINCEIQQDLFWQAANTQVIGNFFQIMPNQMISKGKLNECLSHEDEKMKLQTKICYQTFDFVTDVPFSATCFEAFLKNLPWKLFRIKGTVRFPKQTLMLNYASGQIEWREWEKKESTKLAFIGWDIDSGNILQDLNACLTNNS